MTRYYYTLILSILVATACSENEVKHEQHDEQVTKDVVPDSVMVLQSATEIVQALKKEDYRTIGDAVGNEGKVLFSPYGTVDSLQNTLDKMELYSSTSIEMAWGNFDGSHGPIQLSVDNYFKKFVYDHDYLSDSKVQIAYNKYIGRGNSLNNLKEFYPDHHFVEYYNPGTKKHDYMDWSCLRLVFKKEKDKFLLVGIVHDQGTI